MYIYNRNVYWKLEAIVDYHYTLQTLSIGSVPLLINLYKNKNYIPSSHIASSATKPNTNQQSRQRHTSSTATVEYR